jgi:hypothetical protein
MKLYVKVLKTTGETKKMVTKEDFLWCDKSQKKLLFAGVIDTDDKRVGSVNDTGRNCR